MILLVVCHGQEIFPEYSERRTEKSRDELQVSNLKVQRVLSSHKVAPLQVKIFPLESKVCVFLMCTTFYFLCVCVRDQEKLQSVTEMSAELSSDITNRKQMLLKIEEEIQHVQEVGH